MFPTGIKLQGRRVAPQTRGVEACKEQELTTEHYGTYTQAAFERREGPRRNEKTRKDSGVLLDEKE